jgi:hypothetical protein
MSGNSDLDATTAPMEVADSIGSSPFDKVPEEIISRIFSTGSDTYPIGYWPRNTKRVDRHSAIRNPFADQVAPVCQLWNQITRLRCNQHLWHFSISLEIPSDFPTECLADLEDQLLSGAGFELWIKVSQFRDWTHLNPPIGTGIVIIKVLAITHRMLSPYAHLVAGFELPDCDPLFHQVTRQLFSVMSQWPRIHTLSSPAHLFNLFSENLNDLTESLCDLYGINGGVNAVELSKQDTSSLRSFQLILNSSPGVPIDVVFERKCSDLTYLKYWDDRGTDKPDYGINRDTNSVHDSKLLDLVLNHSRLKELVFFQRLHQVKSFIPSCAGTPHALAKLVLRAVPQTWHTLFHAVEFPNLEELTLDQVPDIEGNPLEYQGPQITLPSLKLLNYWTSDSLQGGGLVAAILANVLQTFNFQAIFHGEIFSMPPPSAKNLEARIMVTSDTPHLDVKRFLASLNLQSTQTLTLWLLFDPMVRRTTAPGLLERPLSRVADIAPALLHLRVHAPSKFLPDHFLSVLLYLGAANLSRATLFSDNGRWQPLPDAIEEGLGFSRDIALTFYRHSGEDDSHFQPIMSRASRLFHSNSLPLVFQICSIVAVDVKIRGICDDIGPEVFGILTPFLESDNENQGRPNLYLPSIDTIAIHLHIPFEAEWQSESSVLDQEQSATEIASRNRIREELVEVAAARVSGGCPFYRAVFLDRLNHEDVVFELSEGV